MRAESKTEWYIAKLSKDGKFMEYRTECGNLMRSVWKDKKLYDGKLCPRCFWNDNYTTLYFKERK